MQDRDAAKPLLWNLRKAFPKLRLAWADGGYAGKLVTWSRIALKLTLQIVRRPDDLHAFKVLPRRWVVERTLAWITRHRRTVRDYERLQRQNAANYSDCPNAAHVMRDTQLRAEEAKSQNVHIEDYRRPPLRIPMR